VLAVNEKAPKTKSTLCFGTEYKKILAGVKSH
jgi:hypothetical protein